MFGLGPAELAVIALLGLLFFGARLPKLARSLGQSVNEFKGGLKEGQEEGVAPTSDETKKESTKA